MFLSERFYLSDQISQYSRSITYYCSFSCILSIKICNSRTVLISALVIYSQTNNPNVQNCKTKAMFCKQQDDTIMIMQ